MNNQSHVVIIGAGISGLTVGWWLHQSGVQVTILERESWVGGTMHTLREDGWLVETGPNSALETTPLFGELFESLGILDRRVYANPSADKRYILRDGRLYAVPTSPISFFKTGLWSPAAKLRLLKEPFVSRGTKEETIAEFVERRLGREFLDYAINPLVAGVFAGNPEELSIRSAFPKLYALEEKYGGLIRGMIGGAKERKKRDETAKDRAKMFSFDEGMSVFPDAIARRLGDRVKLHTQVRTVSRRPLEPGETVRGFVVTAERKGERLDFAADAVIVAVPAFAAEEFVRPFSGDVAERLRSICYPPVAQVFLGFPTREVGRVQDGFGYLIPAVERRSILGTIWSSALFAGRAPERHTALTTFVGGSRQPGLVNYDDADLLSLVTREVQQIMRISTLPGYQKIIRWEKAIPQYNLGYHMIMSAIDDLESGEPGLFLGGNFRGGISVGDCLISSRALATRVLRSLQR